MNGRALCLALLLGLAACTEQTESRELLLATTTSVQDSGLLDELLPLFHEETGIDVRAIAVGTGAALRMGAEGNVDVLLTHAPEAELELVASGAVHGRRPFMENFFVIAGPPEDPLGVAEAESALEAYRRLWQGRARYVSRGDDSGTHRRERALLRDAGLAPEGDWEGYMRTGSGMGLSLQVAGEKRAYILSDMGSFLAFRERTGLVALSREEPELRNVYSILRVNEARIPGRIRAESSQAFERFLVRPDVQRRIASFGHERFGRALFRPLLLEPDGGASVE
ncbi:MAG: substrate-binding domain-containing protein [Myxococcota bacterium]